MIAFATAQSYKVYFTDGSVSTLSYADVDSIVVMTDGNTTADVLAGTTWTWDPDTNNGGRVWGNGGNSGGDWDGSAIWWGCGLIGDEIAEAKGNTFADQMNHSGTGNTDEVTVGAFMTFFSDGTVAKYAPNGSMITRTLYRIEGWTGGAQENWVAGILHVEKNDAGNDNGILFPFQINTDGRVVTDFNISIMTDTQFQLTYYESEPGSWGEATWWRFKKK